MFDAFCHIAFFVFVDLTTGSQFRFVDPFARYDIPVSGWSHYDSSLVVLGCLDFVLHCPVPLVPVVTLLGFVECFGFNIVTLSHSKLGPDFSKKLQNTACLCSQPGLCPVRLIPGPPQTTQPSVTVRSPLCHCLAVTPTL